jgi:lambda repressor-like predicted transcriptional regulator
MFSGMSSESEVNDLMKLKEDLQQAISDLNFTLAAELQEKVDSYRDISAEMEFARIKTEMIDSLDDLAKRLLERRETMVKQSHEEEATLRRNFDDAFEKMKSLHLQEANELNQNLEQTRKTAMDRPYDKFEVLIARAKEAARRGDFTLAEDLHLEANKLKEKEQEKREIAFKQTYDARMAKRLMREKNELQRLSMDSQGVISMFEKKKAIDLQKLNSDFGRELGREYKRAVDSVMRAKAGRKKQESGCFQWGKIPVLLNILEEEYLSVLDKYGLRNLFKVKRDPLVLSVAKSDKLMSPRAFSRMQFGSTKRNAKAGAIDWSQKNNASLRPLSGSGPRKSEDINLS